MVASASGDHMRFLLVDRIVDVQPGRSARGLRAVAGSEDFFTDHFPGNPVMPGVLILESMAQTAGALLAASTNFEKFGLMTFVENAKFRAFVRPGDVLELKVRIDALDEASARTTVTASVGDDPIAAARISFVLVPLGSVIPPEYLEGWKAMIRGWISGHGRTPVVTP
jgi:3-hydroxymyristoyl/3-hydroxydecanoyl-(acyl carrier protein) dehydratase